MLPEGFTVIENFITEDEEDFLITELDHQEWSNKLSRRTQQYGYEYNYYGGTIPEKVNPLPDFLENFTSRITSNEVLNQAIINEYMPGQGIVAHIDSKVFGSEIYSISLGGSVIYELTKGEEKITCFIPRRSLVKMTGEARYAWKHSIPSRKFDTNEGQKIKRTRRISVTLRSFHPKY